jgi:predicted metal-dependent HD superfamily phosphohydrolase
MKNGQWYLVYTCTKIVEAGAHNDSEDSEIPLNATVGSKAAIEAKKKWDEIVTTTKVFKKYQPRNPYIVYKVPLESKDMTMTIVDRMEQRWLDLWNRIGAQGNAHEVYKDLVARYSEPHRHYHTLTHIEYCLDKFKNVRRFANDPNALELAIWYHDAIYDTKTDDNEDKSGIFAMDMTKKVLMNKDFSSKIGFLVSATRHMMASYDSDARLIRDIDLSILGQSKEKFDEYERQIRKEYEWVPDDEYAIKRSIILKSFIDRLVIYKTKFFHDKYESRAVRNIMRSLARFRTFPA